MKPHFTFCLALLGQAWASPVAHFDKVPDGVTKHLRPVLEKRESPQFLSGDPVDGNGKGAPLSGMARQF